MAKSEVTIQPYDGRRLYPPAMGRYVTLEYLAAVLQDEEAFVVRDSNSGPDITRSVRMKIIREQADHG